MDLPFLMPPALVTKLKVATNILQEHGFNDVIDMILLNLGAKVCSHFSNIAVKTVSRISGHPNTSFLQISFLLRMCFSKNRRDKDCFNQGLLKLPINEVLMCFAP